jgi:Ribonuclease G/E
MTTTKCPTCAGNGHGCLLHYKDGKCVGREDCPDCQGTGLAPTPARIEVEHTQVTDEILKIIDTERSRYKVALALTEYLAAHTRTITELPGDWLDEVLDQYGLAIATDGKQGLRRAQAKDAINAKFERAIGEYEGVLTADARSSWYSKGQPNDK